MFEQLTIYVLKSIFSQAVLYLFFVLFLSKERMPVFKRFYLLFSLVYSFLIPFVEFPTNNTIISMYGALSGIKIPFGYYEIKEITLKAPKYVDLKVIVSFGYIMITSFMLARFIFNLVQFNRPKDQNRIIQWNGINIILTHKMAPPYSFFSKIYIHEGDFQKGFIYEAILRHELAHVHQKHSLDIILIEFLLAIFWFNPMVVLYKKSIRLNHEYLADDEAISSLDSVNAYQDLLLRFVFRDNSKYLASSIHYSLTKKRLVMMTKNRLLRVAKLKKLAVAPLFFSLSLFVINAQDPPPPPPRPVSLSANHEFPPPPPIPAFVKDTWWKPVLVKHHIEATGGHIDPNIYVIADKSSLNQNDKLTLYENVLMVIRVNDEYYFLKSPQVEVMWKGDIIKSSEGTLDIYKFDEVSQEPYSKLRFENLVLAIEE